MLHSSECIACYIFCYSWTLSKLACSFEPMTSTRAPPTSVFWESTSKDWLGNYLKIDKSFHNQVKQGNCDHKRKCSVSTTHSHLWLSGLVVHSNTAFHSSEESAITRKPVFKPWSCLRLPHDRTPASSDGAFVRLVIVSSTSDPLSPSTVRWSVEPLVCNYQARWWPPVALIATDGRLKSSRCVSTLHIVQREPESWQIEKEIWNDLPNLLNLVLYTFQTLHRGKETELRWTCTCAPTSGSGYTSATPYYHTDNNTDRAVALVEPLAGTSPDF